MHGSAVGQNRGICSQSSSRHSLLERWAVTEHLSNFPRTPVPQTSPKRKKVENILGGVGRVSDPSVQAGEPRVGIVLCGTKPGTMASGVVSQAHVAIDEQQGAACFSEGIGVEHFPVNSRCCGMFSRLCHPRGPPGLHSRAEARQRPAPQPAARRRSVHGSGGVRRPAPND